MADFVSGKHAISRLYIKKQPWNVRIKSTRVQEVAEEIADQVNGENRARLQKLTDYYKVTHVCYDDGSSQIITNFILNQQNEDANQPQLPLAGGLVFNYLDGSKGGYAMRVCTLGPLDIDISGRKERTMHTVQYRCQYFELVPTV